MNVGILISNHTPWWGFWHTMFVYVRTPTLWLHIDWCMIYIKHQTCVTNVAQLAMLTTNSRKNITCLLDEWRNLSSIALAYIESTTVLNSQAKTILRKWMWILWLSLRTQTYCFWPSWFQHLFLFVIHFICDTFYLWHSHVFAWNKVFVQWLQ